MNTELAIVPETPSDLEAIPEQTHGRSSVINVGGNTVTQATEHLDENSRLLIRWLFDHARRNKWDWATFERETGISSNLAYRIWTDRYRYPVKKRDGSASDNPKAGQRISVADTCQRIAKLKVLHEEREAIFSAGFINISVYDRIEWLCQQCLVRKKLGFLYGESQMGKTTGLKEYTRLHNGGQTTYTEVPPGGGVQFLAKVTAKALHVNPNTAYHFLLEDIVEALDSSKLLIFDEVHRIFTTFQKASVMRCFDFIRYIYDQTGCGIVLSGTNVFRDNLHEQGAFLQYLKQLKRRGLYEVQLPDVPPAEDLRLISHKFGLSSPNGEALKVLNHLAESDGLGMVFTRLTDAAAHAAKRKEKINWDHFTHVVSLINRNAKYAKRS